MIIKTWHQFHIVTGSPWPLYISIQLFSLIFNLSFYLNSRFTVKLLPLKGLVLLIIFFWWKDTVRENAAEGWHSKSVLAGLKVGILIFILSEVFFFISFFWSFFHFFLGPNVEVGQSWPPHFINPINPLGTPLLNTLVLLSSGVRITSAHNYLVSNQIFKTKKYLAFTWILGLYFILLQATEYTCARFNITDSSYGRIFFMGTGFHGAHVIVGSIYLIYCSFILSKNKCNSKNLLSIDLRAWYWHFVDVVWIYLYIFIYWLPYV